jgi:hypothetical protein
MTYSALIYSHSLNPRLQYITDFLSHYYKLSFRLTSDEQTYVRSDIPCKINYSYHRLVDEEIWIHSHALLFESAVHPVKVECFQHHSYKAFFKTQGHTGFDLFAAIFYLITRYEEYLPHKKDMYGRYAHQNALAFRENFLQLPLVNIWLEDFRNLLAEKNPQFTTHQPVFTFQPTYDIDIAWSYRNKGFKRTAGALLKLFLSGKWRSLSQRVGVLRNKRQDPYDAYEWMNELHDKYHLKPIYFFLAGQQRNKCDKNISLENQEFQELIQAHASKYKTALHPSWASGDEPSLLSREKTWLEKIAQHSVNASRQHFIRFDLPETYRRLLRAGITHEYSMGYGSINGFRASVATPFYWYDLKNEEATNLLVHPFCFMDANAYYEQKQSAEESLQELVRCYQTIQSVNGQMITIWHNSFLGTAPEFEGWREAYRQFVATLAEGAIGS